MWTPLKSSYCAGVGDSQVPVLMPMDLMVEASPRRIFANAHTYHINSISVNSDHETYLSADDLRINLWHLEITDRSFSILFKRNVFMMSRASGTYSGAVFPYRGVWTLLWVARCAYGHWRWLIYLLT